MPFRQEILTVANEIEIGLLTTWDLHRLARSFFRWEWRHEDIKDVFYRHGRIQVIPTHYEYLGTVQRFMVVKDVNIVGIKIEESTLSIGDVISFEGPIEFLEQECSSLQHEGQDVTIATPGMVIGTTTELSKNEVPTGTRVFRIAHA